MKRTFLHLLYKIYSLQFFFTRPVTLGVRVMLIRDRQVLLVKHTYQNGWLIPGGGIKRKETPEQAARRECREEVGAEVGALQLIGLYTNYVEHRSDHIVLFVCHDFSIHPKTDFEIERAEFFDMDDLPDDMMEGNRKRIDEFLDGNSNHQIGYW